MDEDVPAVLKKLNRPVRQWGHQDVEREMHPRSAVNANAFTEENKMKLLKDGNSEISKSSAHTEKVPSKKQQEPASKQTARQPWDGQEGSLSSH